MPRVFVVQESTRLRQDGSLEPNKDISSAAEFGDIIVLVAARPFRGDATVYREIEDGLVGFSDGDYLLPIGAPEYIAAAGAVAARENRGRFKILRWLREEGYYVPIEIVAYE